MFKLKQKNLPVYWLIGTVAAVLTAGAVFLHFYPPGKAKFLPPCISHWITGLHCPGCGATRAFYLLTHGDIAGAVSQNLLFLPTIAVLMILTFRPQWGLNRYFAWSIVWIVIVFTVLRNIPCYPFTLLVPYPL